MMYFHKSKMIVNDSHKFLLKNKILNTIMIGYDFW